MGLAVECGRPRGLGRRDTRMTMGTRRRRDAWDLLQISAGPWRKRPAELQHATATAAVKPGSGGGQIEVRTFRNTQQIPSILDKASAISC